MRSLIFQVFLFSFFLSAQNKIEDLDIIVGKWKLAEGDYILYEEWQKINDTIFNGISYSLQDGKKDISERLYIIKLNNKIVYIAQPGNNNPTLFTLINSENNKFVFENKEHDFPQIIVYHFISDSTLNASIEGDEYGVVKRKEFSFRKED